MVAIIVVFIVAVLLVVPSFALLFTLQSRRLLGAGEHGALTAAAQAGHSGQAAAARPRQPPPNGHPDPAARSATLGMIAIAAIIRRRRRH